VRAVLTYAIAAGPVRDNRCLAPRVPDAGAT
jgi:hypothetical protein